MLREERCGAVARLTLDYPERRNALGMKMRVALAEAFDRLEADGSVRAVVLAGAAGTFCAGGDISEMNVSDIEGGRERFRLTHRLVRLIIASRMPVIAAVEGYAIGAGLSLALCCDTIVGGAGAKFAAGFGRIGLIADLGMLHTLPRRVGEGRARQLLLYGEQMTAAEAERIGLIDAVVSDGEAVAAAMTWAERLTGAAALPIGLTKTYFAAGLNETLEWERTVQTMLFLTSDHAEGKAAFLEKRAPVFGRR